MSDLTVLSSIISETSSEPLISWNVFSALLPILYFGTVVSWLDPLRHNSLLQKKQKTQSFVRNEWMLNLYLLSRYANQYHICLININLNKSDALWVNLRTHKEANFII